MQAEFVGNPDEYQGELSLWEPQTRVVRGRPLRLAGILKNASTRDWLFRPVDADALKLGVRVYANRYGGEIVTEVRGVVRASLLRRGRSAPLEVTVSTQALPPGKYTLEIDLLREGAHWFASRGGRPCLHEFEVVEPDSFHREFWPSYVNSIRRGTSETSDAAVFTRLEFLARVVAGFDFTEHRLLQRIDRRARAAESWADTPCGSDADLAESTVIKTFNARVAVRNRTEVPISRFMMHLRSALRVEERWSLDNTRSQFEFAKWYVEEASRHAHCAPPISPQLASFLNADAQPSWLQPLRLSRLIFANLDELPAFIALQDATALPELAWWWGAEFVREKNLDPALIPPYLIAILSRSDGAEITDAGGASPPLSRFARRLYDMDPQFRALYAIEDSVARSAFALDLLATNIGDALGSRLVGEATWQWFEQPLESHPDAVSRLELLLAAYSDGGSEVLTEEVPWRSSEIRAWFRDCACAAEPALARFATASAARASVLLNEQRRSAICRVAGLPGSETGLGLMLRSTLQAMSRVGVPTFTADIYDREIRFVHRAPSTAGRASLQRPITILHINADQVPQALAKIRNRDVFDSYKIGFLLWELEELPRAHWLALDVLDEIWVPTEFLRAVYARHTAKPVVNVRAAVELPARINTPDSRELALPEDSFKFLMSFDFGSSTERKNPLAAVRAFQAAFPGVSQNVCLIIKGTAPAPGNWGDRYGQWPKVMEASLQDRRIKLIEETLAFEDYIGLVATCDCILSPHRSEGFGYLPAYGLLLEKAVIVTDYSGTADFCTPATSFPVRWTPQKLQKGDFIFDAPNAFWADVDVEDLAEQMRTVVEQPSLAKQRAEEGSRIVRERYSTAALAATYANRLAELGVLQT